MERLLKGNAVIGQGGGPTVVINQSLVGIVEQARQYECIERVLGARHGVRGMVNEDFLDLKDLPTMTLEQVAATPAAALGSTRDKVDDDYAKTLFKAFEKHNIRYFFYIGGNDSADTAQKVNLTARLSGYELRAFHVPKTIDNDIEVTDHCPGYGSAARFVACACMGDNQDNRSLPGIKVNVIMGRNAGWLTAASRLAKVYEGDGPHLIYLPEIVLTMEKFLADVEAVYTRLGRCLIAVSEGIRADENTTWTEVRQQELKAAAEKDAHGHGQLSGTGVLGDFLAQKITENINPVAGQKKIRVRADTLGYMQRSFPGLVSPVDAAEARMVGQYAVRCAVSGNMDGSIVIKRTSAAGRYQAYADLEPDFSKIANQVREVPPDWINAEQNGVTDEFVHYALPLVGELPVIGRLT